jgi:hypothetical protein
MMETVHDIRVLHKCNGAEGEWAYWPASGLWNERSKPTLLLISSERGMRPSRATSHSNLKPPMLPFLEASKVR